VDALSADLSDLFAKFMDTIGPNGSCSVPTPPTSPGSGATYYDQQVAIVTNLGLSEHERI